MVANMALDHFKKHFVTATPDENIPRLCPSSNTYSAADKRPVPAQFAAACIALPHNTNDESAIPVPKKQRKKKRPVRFDAAPVERTTKGICFV